MSSLKEKIQAPTLLLDEEKVRANLSRMAEKAKKNDLSFRPHAKTHQSREIANWGRDYGIKALTTSSFRMASYFADDGWKDITVAFPANIREAERIKELAGRIKLNLLAESTETLKQLEDILDDQVGIFIKADTGYGRTGLKPGQWDILDPMVEFMKEANNLTFKGFLCHAGHSYAARDIESLRDVHRESLNQMASLRHRYQNGQQPVIISIGDTPTCSTMDEFSGLDEIRPGNFAFYDLDQLQIGSCRSNDIAIALACPVVALHPERLEAVLYGGGVHLSTERQLLPNGVLHYGYVAEWEDNGWKLLENPAYLRKISQEHGIVRFPTAEKLSKVRIGDLVPVLPVHSCMTADVMKSYLTLDGRKVAMMGLNTLNT